MDKFFGIRTLVAAAVVSLAALLSLTTWDASSGQTPSLPPLPAAVAEPPAPPEPPPPAVPLYDFIEVIDACGPHYDGDCVNMREGPGTEYPVVMQLRNGIVLKVATTTIAVDGSTWYRIGFDGGIRYPERKTSDWYVSAEYVRLFQDPGIIETSGVSTTTTKRIVIDRSEEMLYAYDGDTLFMQQAISTGLEFTPTPLGNFYVYKKMPDSYMQGPLPGISDQYYDLPGVPWDLYFTVDGGAIHGAYWHNNFGRPWSHGCVNLPPDQAEILYAWAEVGTPVKVQQ